MAGLRALWARSKAWALKVAVSVAIAVPLLERVADRIGHLLDLGCLGFH